MNLSFFKPKYWPTWMLLGLMRLIVLLPYRWQMTFGRWLGRVSYPFIKRRKNITKINLRVAFPDKTDNQIESLCKQSFESAGMAAMETAIAWFMSKRRFAKIPIKISNLDAFEKAFYNPDQGAIFLGCHFTCLEIVGRYIGENYQPFSLIYQRHKNPVFEYIMTRSRQSYMSQCIKRKSMRQVVKLLKQKQSLWYAPDQDFGLQHSAFVSFLGHPCATLTVTPWLVKKTQAQVIPVYYGREGNGYHIKFGQAWQDYPSDDVIQDARRYNAFIEQAIQDYPAQYLWQHRRFKTRPEGQEKWY